MTMKEFAAAKPLGRYVTIFVANHKTWKDGVATITLEDWVYQIFHRYYALRLRIKVKNKSDLLFVNCNGGPVKDYHSDVNEWMTRYKYPVITSNGLRKITQTGVATQTADVQEQVCENLAHSAATAKQNYRAKTAKQATIIYQAVQTVHLNSIALRHFQKNGLTLFPSGVVPPREEAQKAFYPLLGHNFERSERTHAMMVTMWEVT